MQNIKQFECTRFYKEWTIVMPLTCPRYTSKQLQIGIAQNDLYNFLTTNHLPNLLVITQEYETNAEREYVIIGNTALMKCEIPSFVADFVSVESWKDNKNNEYFTGISNNYGKFPPLYEV